MPCTLKLLMMLSGDRALSQAFDNTLFILDSVAGTHGKRPALKLFLVY